MTTTIPKKSLSFIQAGRIRAGQTRERSRRQPGGLAASTTLQVNLIRAGFTKSVAQYVADQR